MVITATSSFSRGGGMWHSKIQAKINGIISQNVKLVVHWASKLQITINATAGKT